MNCQYHGCGEPATFSAKNKFWTMDGKGNYVRRERNVHSCEFHSRHEDLYEVKPLEEMPDGNE